MHDDVAGDASALPLDGVRVVAMEQAVAAPLGTRHLADLGAEVIKVERVGEGDFARSYDTAVNGVGSHFVWLNRGKKSLALDVKSSRGARLLADLVDTADVFVQNLAPGAAARLGLDADTLRGRNPRLVTVDVSGYGESGPHAGRKAYDMLVQAETGLVSITGTPEQAVKTGIPTADIAAGMYIVTSVLSALLRRERTGAGAGVDVAMFDATAEWLGHPMYVAMYAGRQLPRLGMSHAAIAPYDVYPTRDGQVLIGVQNDRGWQALCRDVLGDEALLDDPRFTTNVLRVEHRGACDAEVGVRTAVFDTAVLERRLVDAGVAAAQVNDMAGLVAHPQLSERDRWREVRTERGPIRALLPPMTYRDVELVMGDVPALGQHTDETLVPLGVTEDELDDLRAAGVIQ
ncbi:CaiB/BaiF CoA transferase family protein [Prauserella rugosa]|uniref:Crotonobetainyl-CoA:carnitine CoA-transferase CaiB-like acyl-CoA transferase n=1 Tax=Prauserella rugosa TaxID=43354 RepID=A0A660CDC5_9PSEU|nr:CaiB/BaiF CoA-transferase family protein [Prauserella rugosa]TWH20404.1 crotonobetainyl-CoA:carnitine CoA-transferase CaiB-like acyl-CoA transferase [Prauserella rugosa]